ncbi:hypothetical protein N2152v2_004675 [Parachlorella kessleri]
MAAKGNGVLTELSPRERVILDGAKSEHAETTQAAKRALQVAEQTHDVARGTLVEIHRQGQQLDKAEAGFEVIEEEVVEASSILRFMRRWCCIRLICCCDCFDPDVQRDRLRKRRVAQKKEDLQATHANIELQYQAKQETIDRLVKQEDSAANMTNETAARSELFSRADTVKASYQAREPKGMDIGHALPEEDRREIQQQTDEQDEYLDKIGQAVGALRIMSEEMHSELGQHDPKIERLQRRAEASHDKLGGLAREARRV